MRFLTSLTVAAALLATPVLAQTLDKIKETGELRLGFRTDAAPLSYLDTDGIPAGYTPTVCASVAELIAAELELPELNATFYPVDSTNRFDKVANGEIDILCGAATITLSRLEKVNFSVPTYVDGTAIMLPKEADTELTALEGKKVGVLASTTTEETLKNSLEAAGITADVISFDDHAAGLAAMEAEEISAYFADQSILLELFFSSDASDTFVVSENILTIEKQGLALPRNDDDFRLAVDRALSTLYSNGTMERIFEETLPGATPGIAIRAMHIIAPTLP